MLKNNNRITQYIWYLRMEKPESKEVLLRGLCAHMERCISSEAFMTMGLSESLINREIIESVLGRV